MYRRTKEYYDMFDKVYYKAIECYENKPFKSKNGRKLSLIEHANKIMHLLKLEEEDRISIRHEMLSYDADLNKE